MKEGEQGQNKYGLLCHIDLCDFISVEVTLKSAF